jgi:diacylglycerol kinase (CTP)
MPDADSSLSWADTAASTIGRLWGSRTPKLPSRLPILRLPLSPRKSLAGFLAATMTGSLVAITWWGYFAPMRDNSADVTWRFDTGIQSSGSFSGWTGLTLIGIVAGLVTGIAEALGTCMQLINSVFLDCP